MIQDKSKLNKILTALNSIVSEEAAPVEAKPEATVEAKEVSLAQAMIEGVTIEAEEFAVGMPVFAVSDEGEKIPLEEGSYTTDEGNMFAVDDNGVIASIGEESVTEEEEVEEQDMNKETPAAKKVIESETVSRETFFSAIEELKSLISDKEAEAKTALAAKDAEIEELKTQLSATPAEKATKVAPTEKQTTKALFNRAKGVNAGTTKERVNNRLSGLWTK